MRQAGYLAAACLYAIENNVERLAIDHQHAKQIAAVLENLSWIKEVLPCETNILIFTIDETKTSVEAVLDYLKENGILAVQFGKHQIRLVFHLDISQEMVEEVERIFRNFR